MISNVINNLSDTIITKHKVDILVMKINVTWF